MSSNRLLLELHKTIKDLNREIINPEIEELKLSGFSPIITMVAKARAAYLKEVFNIANAIEGDLPTTEQIKRLHYLRVTFEELASGSQALETAIERGYIDCE